MIRISSVGILLLMLAAGGMAQDKPMAQTAATAKFGGLPVLPSCMTFAVEKGDPTKGPSILLIKAASGCVVPWHWHTANEQLLFVSGSGKAQMKDDKPMPVKPGDFVYLPGKHVHTFTCVASCMMFDVVEGAFDIHYVDKEGKEVPPESVLKEGSPGKKKVPPKT